MANSVKVKALQNGYLGFFSILIIKTQNYFSGNNAQNPKLLSYKKNGTYFIKIHTMDKRDGTFEMRLKNKKMVKDLREGMK